MAWRNLIQGTVLQNYLKIGQAVLEKKNFKRFFVWLPWKQEFCVGPKNWRNSGDDIERMLSVKFHPNWPTGYRENYEWQTTHDGQKAITITRVGNFVLRWAKNPHPVLSVLNCQINIRNNIRKYFAKSSTVGIKCQTAPDIWWLWCWRLSINMAWQLRKSVTHNTEEYF